MLPTAALLLADTRLPAGGHAQSTGLESAAAADAVHDLASLRSYTLGRLWTTGLTTASLAAATAHAAGTAEVDWTWLDAEAGARVVSPVLRAVSRRLGRQLLRAAVAAWPDPVLDEVAAALPGGAHHPVALGATGAAAGLDPHAVAVCAGYLSVTEATGAAVRLLGLDPYGVARLVAGLLDEVEAVADEAAAAAGGPLADLPCPSSPRLDAGAEDHATWEVRLFAS